MSGQQDQEKQSILAQLKQLVEGGESPEEAVSRVLAPYGGPRTDPLCKFVWPALLKLARGLHGKRSNESARRTLFHSRPYKTDEQREEANAVLRKTVMWFQGKPIVWDDLTIENLEIKIAWIRTHIGTMVDTLRVMEHAKELIIEHGVKRLGDIDNWPDLLRERAGANALDDVDTPALP